MTGAFLFRPCFEHGKPVASAYCESDESGAGAGIPIGGGIGLAEGGTAIVAGAEEGCIEPAGIEDGGIEFRVTEFGGIAPCGSAPGAIEPGGTAPCGTNPGGVDPGAPWLSRSPDASSCALILSPS